MRTKVRVNIVGSNKQTQASAQLFGAVKKTVGGSFIRIGPLLMYELGTKSRSWIRE